MDDMNAFEQQIASVVQQTTRSPRPVDVTSIVRNVASQPSKWRFQSMFSATKFVVAGAIVALFGGFLLAGVLTQPTDEQGPAVGTSASATTQATAAATSEAQAVNTTTRSDLLPGVDLRVEETQPGVFRVVSDGQRELRWIPGKGYWVTPSAITVAPDGGVWSFTLPKYTGEGCRVEPGEVGCMTFYRLGSSETHEMLDEWILDDGAIIAGNDPIAVAPDGTIWAIVRRSYESAAKGNPELRSFDGEAWTVRRDGAFDVTLARDGSVWALWRNANDRIRLGRLTDEGWSSVQLARSDGPADRHRLVTGADGDVYLFFEDDDGSMQRVEDLERYVPVVDAEMPMPDMTPHEGGGIYWWTDESELQPGALVRFDGAEEARFDIPTKRELLRVVAVDRDGIAWVAAQIDGGGCDGIHRFDGSEYRHFLAGTCPASADLAPDGSIWLQAVPNNMDADGAFVDTYVITPQAWSATELPDAE